MVGVSVAAERRAEDRSPEHGIVFVVAAVGAAILWMEKFPQSVFVVLPFLPKTTNSPCQVGFAESFRVLAFKIVGRENFILV